ncbi:hypothetical protein [Burkholderia ubonensis]|uniref:hypothetical protein n=1 Tax=Burkholderia ubonensis TaxID=101571 RepID=UPI0018DFF98B|nr:hypothetical protein [Burkholderia ubonensis]
MSMVRPVFYADFNEMVDADTVLLSVDDSKRDASGVVVLLREGMLVSIYMDDYAENGTIDNLVAQGVVVRNSRADWSAHVKWCCHIDGNGIRAQSEVDKCAGG